MTDYGRKDLIERLRKRWFTHGCEQYQLEAADQIEADGKRIAELEAFQQHAIKQICELAREAGEAKGKLEGSEMPGIVDGWREKCEAQAKRIVELENANQAAAECVAAMMEECARYRSEIHAAMGEHP